VPRCTFEEMQHRPPRLSDEDYLKHVKKLANVVCDEASAEGWLTYLPDDDDQTPFRGRSTNWLAVFAMSTTRATVALMRT